MNPKDLPYSIKTDLATISKQLPSNSDNAVLKRKIIRIVQEELNQAAA